MTRIGAGGMGEVYQARDVRLNRDVAIKVLPPNFAADRDRLARFEREAQTLAALNHPHIAQIYGVVEIPPADGGQAPGTGLVMEFVEGEDLAERLTHGAMPIDDALVLARQVAEALQAAHERGIVHRDLKPANVRVTPDGRVKVLDFGLAKALEPQGSDPSAVGDPAANSPTFTMHATEMGMVVGTAAYMSPEQARGKAVDRRTDVWAFGVVLYEMLTGKRAFGGDEISDVIAAVLRDRVPLETLPANVPPAIHRLLRRCLEKDRAKRLDSMAVVGLEIDETLNGAGGDTAEAPVVAGSRRAVHIAWLLPTIAVLVLGAYVAMTRPWQTHAASPSLLIAADPGFDGTIVTDLLTEIAFSPDGRTLVFAGRERQGGRTRLYVRTLDRLGATMLEGTDDASYPFFSPDGQWIGFFVASRLCKVPIHGGAVAQVADVVIPRGATWGDDDVITFAPQAVPGGVLMRVPAAGGTPVRFGPMLSGHQTQRWPQAMPGSRTVLYTGAATVDSFEDACLMVQEPGGAPKLVQCGGYAWRYLPDGHILYVHNGTLFAAPFDPSALKLTGGAVPVVQQVRSTPTSGAAQYAVSAAGVLVYVPGDRPLDQRPLSIVDRGGHAVPLNGIPAGWQSIALSPDGRQLAMDVLGPNGGIWVYDSARASATRLTLRSGDQGPVWTPDGGRITYASALNGPPNLWWAPADGSSEPARLSQSESPQIPLAWSPNGRTLIFSQANVRKFDMWALSLVADGAGLKAGASVPFIATPANEGLASFSPDGKWIAYTSDDSGTYQIYVRAANGAGARYQMSVTDGVWAQWSRTKPELLLGGLDGQISFVTYTESGGAFRASRPEAWGPARYEVRGTTLPYVPPDNDHVVMPMQQTNAPVDKLILVTGFLSEPDATGK